MQERIEELLSSDDAALILQGLFLLESLESPTLLEGLASSCRIEALLGIDWSPPWRSAPLRATHALAQVRVYQRLAVHQPARLASEARLELCLRRLPGNVFRAELDLVDPRGRHIPISSGAVAETPAAAFAAAAPLAARVGIARSTDVLRILGMWLLDGSIARNTLAHVPLLTELIGHFLQTDGPWRLSMNGLPGTLLSAPGVLSRLSWLSLAGSDRTVLPPDGPDTLLLDAVDSRLEVLPGWVRRLSIDERGWARWRSHLDRITDLTLQLRSWPAVDGARLDSLRSLQIHAPDMAPALAWLATLPPMEQLWLSADSWAPPPWLWDYPAEQISLEGAQFAASELPPAPPATLQRLLLPPLQLHGLPPAWAAIAAPIVTRRRIFLQMIGPRKINLIKAVREHTGLGLRDAKLLVESAPCHLLTAATPAMADRICRELRHLGAVASLRA